LLLIHLKKGGFQEFMAVRPELVEGAEGVAS
jgi:hypothetical protein